MYIFKNAYLNIIRSKGRNVLIGIIIMIITISSCIAITINKSGNDLVDSYKNSNPIKVTIGLDTMQFRKNGEIEDFEFLDIDIINKIGSFKSVDGYYYTLESYLNSDISFVDYEDLFKNDEPDNDKIKPDDFKGNMDFKKSMGDFNIIAYSDISYNEDFINGDKKIISGDMIFKDSAENEIVISEELATLNDLSVGDIINFTNAYDEEISYDLKIIGIYEIVNDTSSMQVGQGFKTSDSNIIYTNIEILNRILEDNGIENQTYSMFSSITSAFYVDYENLDTFNKEIESINLGDYYKVQTNLEEITSTLTPIKNISSFSITFLIITFIVGLSILIIINLFNIRERKYEIGVLRAIGMTKFKVTLSLVSELLMVAFVSALIGTILGVSLSQPVSNYMLKNEIENYNNNQNMISENFGSDKFQRPGFENNFKGMIKPGNEANTNFVDTLTIHTDFVTILELFGIILILTILSGSVSVMYVNKFEPNKILQERG